MLYRVDDTGTDDDDDDDLKNRMKIEIHTWEEYIIRIV